MSNFYLLHFSCEWCSLTFLTVRWCSATAEGRGWCLLWWNSNRSKRLVEIQVQISRPPTVGLFAGAPPPVRIRWLGHTCWWSGAFGWDVTGCCLYPPWLLSSSASVTLWWQAACSSPPGSGSWVARREVREAAFILVSSKLPRWSKPYK